ncbi:hypothetical protein [Bacillus mycoides]|nr:hypothetical protein [Bacillus mycoides]EOO33615.1 hypothetical protein IKK_05940 [Bacillus mycoides]QWH98237.1 hypothetical protein EXW36_30660 [Bacillus mycoides]
MSKIRRYPREPGDSDPEPAPKPDPPIDDPQPSGPFHFKKSKKNNKI